MRTLREQIAAAAPTGPLTASSAERIPAKFTWEIRRTGPTSAVLVRIA